MTERTIREIQIEKGTLFSTKFILAFEKEWEEVTGRLRRYAGVGKHRADAAGIYDGGIN